MNDALQGLTILDEIGALDFQVLQIGKSEISPVNQLVDMLLRVRALTDGIQGFHQRYFEIFHDLIRTL